MTSPSDLPAWKALLAEHQQSQSTTLSTLFEQDPGRFDRYSLDAAGLMLDYSKNRINDQVMQKLLALAEQSDVVG